VRSYRRNDFKDITARVRKVFKGGTKKRHGQNLTQTVLCEPPTHTIVERPRDTAAR